VSGRSVSCFTLVVLLGVAPEAGARQQPPDPALRYRHLHQAIRADRIDILKRLLDQGAEINRKDNVGWSALHLATWLGRREMVELLRTRGAPMDAFVSAGLGLDAEAVAMLKEDPSLVQGKAGQGTTLLHWAALGNTRALAEVLLAQGAAVDAASRRDETPLAVAA